MATLKRDLDRRLGVGTAANSFAQPQAVAPHKRALTVLRMRLG